MTAKNSLCESLREKRLKEFECKFVSLTTKLMNCLEEKYALGEYCDGVVWWINFNITQLIVTELTVDDMVSIIPSETFRHFIAKVRADARFIIQPVPGGFRFLTCLIEQRLKRQADVVGLKLFTYVHHELSQPGSSIFLFYNIPHCVNWPTLANLLNLHPDLSAFIRNCSKFDWICRPFSHGLMVLKGSLPNAAHPSIDDFTAEQLSELRSIQRDIDHCDTQMYLHDQLDNNDRNDQPNNIVLQVACRDIDNKVLPTRHGFVLSAKACREDQLSILHQSTGASFCAYPQIFRLAVIDVAVNEEINFFRSASIPRFTDLILLVDECLDRLVTKLSYAEIFSDSLIGHLFSVIQWPSDIPKSDTDEQLQRDRDKFKTRLCHLKMTDNDAEWQLLLRLRTARKTASGELQPDDTKQLELLEKRWSAAKRLITMIGTFNREIENREIEKRENEKRNKKV